MWRGYKNQCTNRNGYKFPLLYTHIYVHIYLYAAKQLTRWVAHSFGVDQHLNKFQLEIFNFHFTTISLYWQLYIYLCMYVYACMSDRNQCVLHADALEISVNGITYNSNWPHQIIVFENICIAFDNLAGGRRCTVASWQTNFPL